jgi:hypothetical protein
MGMSIRSYGIGNLAYDIFIEIIVLPAAAAICYGLFSTAFPQFD